MLKWCCVNSLDALLAQRTTPNVLCLIKTMHLKALGFVCKIKKHVAIMKARFYVQIKRKVQWHRGRLLTT